MSGNEFNPESHDDTSHSKYQRVKDGDKRCVNLHHGKSFSYAHGLTADDSIEQTTDEMFNLGLEGSARSRPASVYHSRRQERGKRAHTTTASVYSSSPVSSPFRTSSSASESQLLLFDGFSSQSGYSGDECSEGDTNCLRCSMENLARSPDSTSGGLLMRPTCGNRSAASSTRGTLLTSPNPSNNSSPRFHVRRAAFSLSADAANSEEEDGFSTPLTPSTPRMRQSQRRKRTGGKVYSDTDGISDNEDSTTGGSEDEECRDSRKSLGLAPRARSLPNINSKQLPVPMDLISGLDSISSMLDSSSPLAGGAERGGSSLYSLSASELDRNCKSLDEFPVGYQKKRAEPDKFVPTWTHYPSILEITKPPPDVSGVNFITPKTLIKLLDGNYPDGIKKVVIVDCRYKFEFDGGHIKNALHVPLPEHIPNYLPFEGPGNGLKGSEIIVIFHCELSKERGPRAYQYFRNMDAKHNLAFWKDNYRPLTYPHLYVLRDGYSRFFQHGKDYCEPQMYQTMNDKNFTAVLEEEARQLKLQRKGELRTQSYSEVALLSMGSRRDMNRDLIKLSLDQIER